jgi:hypothetical protein
MLETVAWCGGFLFFNLGRAVDVGYLSNYQIQTSSIDESPEVTISSQK